MQSRWILFASTWLAATTAVAQTAAPAAKPLPVIPQNWIVQPAATTTGDYHVGTLAVQEPPKSPFKFKDRDEGGVLSLPPPRPRDRDAVMGTGRAWLDGRPPLDCAVTPQDPKCH